jgi:hypothetical protein
MFMNCTGITTVAPIAGWNLAAGATITNMFFANVLIPRTILSTMPDAFSGTAWPQSGNYF